MRTVERSDRPEVVRTAMLPKGRRGVGTVPNHIIIHEDHAEIQIMQKGRLLSVLIDHADIERCRNHRWRIGQNKYGYKFVQATICANGIRKTIRLARVLLGITDPNIWVDHEDGDSLNNRRDNLRTATPQQNAQNRRAPGPRTLPRGVSIHASGAIRSRYMVNGQERHVGLFSSVEEAEIAVLKARADAMPYDRTSAHYRRGPRHE